MYAYTIRIKSLFDILHYDTNKLQTSHCQVGPIIKDLSIYVHLNVSSRISYLTNGSSCILYRSVVSKDLLACHSILRCVLCKSVGITTDFIVQFIFLKYFIN